MFISLLLFYQDFNEQFEGYTQRAIADSAMINSCFIRISMNNLKDIHNYKTISSKNDKLFYQDFNEQFEGYTQQGQLTYQIDIGCFIRISMNNLKDIHNISSHNQHWIEVVLSGFQ